MTDHTSQVVTWIAGSCASVTGGTLLFTINDLDMSLRLALTSLTILSVLLLIGVNWERGFDGLKKLYDKIVSSKNQKP